MKGNKTSNNRQLLIKVLIRLVLAIIVLGLIFFLPAGSIKFWEAWAYMGILFIPMIFVLIYLLKNDPELLERRMKMKEKEEPQKVFIKLSLLVFFIAFIIPGFDYRFEWSKVLLIVIIIADLFIFIGYLLFFLVLKENTYASRIIEVEKGQKVISTGPYAIIRHPMYVAVLMMYVLSPLALGSYWAVLAILPLPVLVIFRIKSEEKILRDKLPGYREYTQKVKYRLIPYIW
ncbi:MAG: isoprenylcysteine carboxylmethyltransferase family protein [Atribacterota bacterium]|nr:isoprenylcysteine carboxylmethyltransferase family protein [Atribacterota bacterium]